MELPNVRLLRFFIENDSPKGGIILNLPAYFQNSDSVKNVQNH